VSGGSSVCFVNYFTGRSEKLSILVSLRGSARVRLREGRGGNVTVGGRQTGRAKTANEIDGWTVGLWPIGERRPDGPELCDTSGVRTAWLQHLQAQRFRTCLTKGHRARAVAAAHAFPPGRARGLFCLIPSGNLGYYMGAEVGSCGRIAKENETPVFWVSQSCRSDPLSITLRRIAAHLTVRQHLS
jgi:hypothetical protein